MILENNRNGIAEKIWNELQYKLEEEIRSYIEPCHVLGRVRDDYSLIRRSFYRQIRKEVADVLEWDFWQDEN